MTQQQKADKYEANLNAQLTILMLKLGTTAGFRQYYFDILSKCKNQKAAFEITNLLYFLIWGEYKYSSDDSFRKSKNKFLKNGTQK